MSHGYEKWLGSLGVSDAPATRRNLASALMFFHREMPGLPREMRFKFLKGMDLHEMRKPVRPIFLEAGTLLAAFRKMKEDPLRLFYTKPGSSINHLGLNPWARQFRKYRVRSRCVALFSRSGPIIDTWTQEHVGYAANGGADQYIIPNAHLVLETIQ